MEYSRHYAPRLADAHLLKLSYTKVTISSTVLYCCALLKTTTFPFFQRSQIHYRTRASQFPTFSVLKIALELSHYSSNLLSTMGVGVVMCRFLKTLVHTSVAYTH
jgi:hypothetical protein